MEHVWMITSVTTTLMIGISCFKVIITNTLYIYTVYEKHNEKKWVIDETKKQNSLLLHLSLSLKVSCTQF